MGTSMLARISDGLFKFLPILIVAAYFLCGQNSYAEDNDGNRVDIEAVLRLRNATLYVYDPPYIVKAKYHSIEEVTNSSPEELMASIRSAITQDWMDFNYETKGSAKITEEQLSNRRKLDPNTNYFKLIHKFSFDYQGQRIALVKYRLFKNAQRDYLVTTLMRETKGVWRIASVPGSNNIRLIVKHLKSSVLKALLRPRDSGSTYPLINELYDNTRGSNDNLLVDKLIDYISEMHESGRHEDLSEIVDLL